MIIGNNEDSHIHDNDDDDDFHDHEGDNYDVEHDHELRHGNQGASLPLRFIMV